MATNMLRQPFVFRNFMGITGVKNYSVASEVQSVKPFSEIPKVPTLPVVGAGWAYLPFIGKYKLTAMHHASESKYKDYGSIVRETLNKDIDVVHIYEPEDFQKVFRNEGRYPFRRPLAIMKTYREARKNIYQNIGLFVNNGEDWYQVRSDVQPHMMKPKAIHYYLSAMDEVATQLIDNTIRMRNENGGEVKDYLNELYNWALESVGIVALDARLGCLDTNPNTESTKLIKLVGELLLQALLIELSPLPIWKYVNTPMKKKFYKNMDEFSELVVKYLNEAKKRLETRTDAHESTFLETLLCNTKDPKHITTMLIDMFFAGIDTTSTTVGLTLYHLARNPKAQEKAHQEVKKLLQEKGMSLEALNEIKYLKACVKESMRLTPVTVASARNLPEEMVIRGYRIPAGTMIVMNTYVAGRLEKNFSNPEAYHPERFLREESSHDPFAFLPFGFGPRSCVGRRIAEQEIWILLMRILERFRVEYRHGDIDLLTRLISTPSKPLDFHFYER